MKRIYLRNIKRYALVDDCDFDWVSGFGWYGYRTKKDHADYARANVYYSPGDHEVIHLHRLIAGAASGEAVTFRNRNRLDCRRSNLVIASRAEIVAHGERHAPAAAPYRGITERSPGRWSAALHHHPSSSFLGTYSTPELAALAYDRAAREVQGDLSTLNFPNVTDYSHVVPDRKPWRDILKLREGRYLGVSWNQNAKKWHVRIKHNGKLIHIGYFRDPIEGARAYDTKALELRGEGAALNFPNGEGSQELFSIIAEALAADGAGLTERFDERDLRR